MNSTGPSPHAGHSQPRWAPAAHTECSERTLSSQRATGTRTSLAHVPLRTGKNGFLADKMCLDKLHCMRQLRSFLDSSSKGTCLWLLRWCFLACHSVIVKPFFCVGAVHANPIRLGFRRCHRQPAQGPSAYRPPTDSRASGASARATARVEVAVQLLPERRRFWHDLHSHNDQCDLRGASCDKIPSKQRKLAFRPEDAATGCVNTPLMSYPSRATRSLVGPLQRFACVRSICPPLAHSTSCIGPTCLFLLRLVVQALVQTRAVQAAGAAALLRRLPPARARSTNSPSSCGTPTATRVGPPATTSISPLRRHDAAVAGLGVSAHGPRCRDCAAAPRPASQCWLTHLRGLGCRTVFACYVSGIRGATNAASRASDSWGRQLSPTTTLL